MDRPLMDRSIDSKGAKLSRKIPSYLKLHKEELSSAPSPQDEVDIPHWSTLQDSFAEATGWKLDLFGPESETQTPCPRSLTPTDVVLTRGTEKSEPRVSKDVAHRLAESVSGLVDQLQHSLNTVWQREAELAAGIPVCERTDEDEHLANRLSAAVIQGSAGGHTPGRQRDGHGRRGRRRPEPLGPNWQNGAQEAGNVSGPVAGRSQVDPRHLWTPPFGSRSVDRQEQPMTSRFS